MATFIKQKREKMQGQIDTHINNTSLLVQDKRKINIRKYIKVLNNILSKVDPYIYEYISKSVP